MKEETKEIFIAAFQNMQKLPGVALPCPRCGKYSLNRDNDLNALSRHTDVYICAECATDEAIRDLHGNILPIEEWDSYKTYTGNWNIAQIEQQYNEEMMDSMVFFVPTELRCEVWGEDIKKIIEISQESKYFSDWCSAVNFTDQSIIDQLMSETGIIYSNHLDGKEYVLTLLKLLHGIRMYILREGVGECCLEWLEEDAAEIILEYALFGEPRMDCTKVDMLALNHVKSL